MDVNEEKWINDVMSSLDDVKSAEANPFLYTRIQNSINSKSIEQAPKRLIWLVAASFVLLLLLNFKIIRSNSSSSKSVNNEAQTLADSYQLLNENPFNYN